MILKEFEDAGYYVKHKVLVASDFGVPQKRERVFIIGFKNYENFAYHQFPSSININKSVLGDVVDLEKEVDKKYFFSQRAVDGMLRVREKMNKGRVMSLDKPCNTISSHLAKVSLNGTDPVLFYNNRYRRFYSKRSSFHTIFSEKI